MPHAIPRAPRLHLARPGGTPPAEPARGLDARAPASDAGLDEAGPGGGGELAADRHGDAGTG